MLLVPGYAAGTEPLSERDLSLLPAYCRYVNTSSGHSDRAAVDHWRSIIGPTFEHLHHYCWGLNAINHATLFARTDAERRHYLGESIGAFQYVLDRATAHFVLLPEIYTKQGESYLALGNVESAIRAFEQAIAAKPDYWPPYADAADYYRRVGQSETARKWLERGLAAAPDTNALKHRLVDLNSDKRK